MSIDISFTNNAKLVKVESLTKLLTDFRQQLEQESGDTINHIDANAAGLLSDLCHFLGLSDANRRKVLGVSGARHVDVSERFPSATQIKH